MTMQQLDTPIFYPPIHYGWPGVAEVNLDADGDAVGMVMEIPRSGTLTHVVFTTGATATTSGPISLYIATVGADGTPTTTLFHANGTGSVTVSAAATQYEIALASGGFTVSPGDLIAICLYVATGDGTRYSIKSVCDLGLDSDTRPDRPYNIGDTTGSTGDPSSSNPMTIGPDTRSPAIGIVLATSDYTKPSSPYMALGVSASGNDYFTSSGSDEVGHRIKVPFKCRATGGWVGRPVDAAGSTWKMRLTDSSGNELAVSNTIDEDAASGSQVVAEATFTSPYTLQPDTVYYLFRHALTGGLRNYYCEYDDNKYLDCHPNGKEIYKASRDNSTPGTITPDTTRTYGLGLIIDQLDDGAGGGGSASILAPNMRGGML